MDGWTDESRRILLIRSLLMVLCYLVRLVAMMTLTVLSVSGLPHHHGFSKSLRYD